MADREKTFEEKREMVWEDFGKGLISEERANEMLRVISEHEEAATRAAKEQARAAAVASGPRIVNLTVEYGDSEEVQSFSVVRSEEDERRLGLNAFVRWQPGQDLECEICGTALGCTDHGFVPYSVDGATTVLCQEHCEEAVTRSIWPGNIYPFISDPSDPHFDRPVPGEVTP